MDLMVQGLVHRLALLLKHLVRSINISPGTGLKPVTPNRDNELCILFDLGASHQVATPAGGNPPSQTLKPPHLQNYNTNTRAKNGVCFQKNTTKKHKNNILCLNKVKVY